MKQIVEKMKENNNILLKQQTQKWDKNFYKGKIEFCDLILNFLERNKINKILLNKYIDKKEIEYNKKIKKIFKKDLNEYRILQGKREQLHFINIFCLKRSHDIKHRK